jgi:hypothetical protein
MLDARNYAQHFPDEQSATPEARPTSVQVTPTPALLAALYQLEKEFKEILRTQQPEHTERSE